MEEKILVNIIAGIIVLIALVLIYLIIKLTGKIFSRYDNSDNKIKIWKQ